MAQSKALAFRAYGVASSHADALDPDALAYWLAWLAGFISELNIS